MSVSVCENDSERERNELAYVTSFIFIWHARLSYLLSVSSLFDFV